MSLHFGLLQIFYMCGQLSQNNSCGLPIPRKANLKKKKKCNSFPAKFTQPVFFLNNSNWPTSEGGFLLSAVQIEHLDTLYRCVLIY